MTLHDWKVLIVEDEPDSMELVQGILEYYGIVCRAATSAEQALKVLETWVPTLIIVDLHLPDMDGWGLLSELKKNRATADVPRVAISAYHSLDVATKAIEYGFEAYFSKPLDTTSFIRELSGIVNNRTA